METTLSKSERTRQFIVETTSGIFNTKGYEGTSLTDLTTATGLTKGSIYGNFTNKEEVALAAFDDNLDRITKMIREQIAQANTFYDKLMVYAKVYRAYAQKPFPEGGCPILNTAIETDDIDSLLKESAAKAVLRWKRGITNLLQSGVKTGEFKANIDHEQFAVTMIALIEGGLMIAKVTDTPASMDLIVRSVALLLDQVKN